MSEVHATDTEFTMTQHAVQRMAQRNVSPEDVQFVVFNGKRFCRAGAIHYFLGRKDILMAGNEDEDNERLVGTTVVVSRGKPIVITVYRNRQDGLRNIKRKPRYSYAASGQ